MPETKTLINPKMHYPIIWIIIASYMYSILVGLGIFFYFNLKTRTLSSSRLDVSKNNI